MNEKKCKQCGTWNDSKNSHCINCETAFVDVRSSERSLQEKTELNPFPMLSILSDDSVFTKIWKVPVMIGQLIFLSILSVIAAIASSTVH